MSSGAYGRGRTTIDGRGQRPLTGLRGLAERGLDVVTAIAERTSVGEGATSMEDHERADGTLGLTAEIAQSIFPIARSDRRKHKDLFVSIVEEARLRDDKSFYGQLVSAINSRNTSCLKAYDKRMSRAGDMSKCFAVRAAKWLFTQNSEKTRASDPRKLAPDHFELGTAERAVHRLYLDLVAEGDDEPEIVEANEAMEESVSTGPWSAIVHDLIETARGLNAPDVAVAERLVEIAEALADACRRVIVAEEARRQAASRRASLRERALALDPTVAIAWTDTAAADDLDELESALRRAEGAFGTLAECKDALEVLHQELSTAIAERDYNRGRDLFSQSEEAAEVVRRAERDWMVARAAMVASASGGESDRVAPVSRDANLKRLPDATSELDTIPPKDEVAQELIEAPDLPEPSPAEFVSQEEPDFDDMASANMASDFSDGEAADDRLVAYSERQTEPCLTSVVVDAQADLVDVEVSTAVSTIPIDGQESEPPFSDACDRESDDEGSKPDALLKHYLDAGEFSFAWHLARLRSTSVPAPILRALTILPAIQSAEDMADPRRSSALAELAAALPDAGDTVAASRLALAALLRPALFDPDHGARDQLRNVIEFPGGAIESAALAPLCDLGYDVRLSVGLLAELAGKPPALAVPAVCRRLADWLSEARHRKTMHQPTYAIFHRELKPEGEVGRVVEAVLAGAPDAEELARTMISRLAHDRGEQELFVLEAERRAGRPRRDQIEGTPLEWFCRGLEEACDHLSDWLDARRQDARNTRDQGRDRLLRVLGPIRKAIETVGDRPSADEGALEAAARRVLVAKVQDIRDLIDGRIEAAPVPRFRDLLEAPLLRLPGGCQDWSEEVDPAFADERKERDRRLGTALCRPSSIARDIARAFEVRLSEHATLAAKQLLERMVKAGLSNSEAAVRQQRLDEVVESSRREARERVAKLRQSLTTIGYLDLDAATTLPRDLSRLALVDIALAARPVGDEATIPALNRVRRPDVPADFPELRTLLEEMEARRDTLRAQIAVRQRQELERLEASSQGASARALLECFDQLDPVTADDAIAEIKAGRAVPMPEPNSPDVFERFFDRFVGDIAGAAEDTRRGRLHAALDTRGTAGPLDFCQIDDRRAGRLKALLEVWGGAENAMQRSQGAGLRETLTKLFGLIGLTGVRLPEGREASPARLWLMTMHCDVPRRADGFLPPVFGSAAGGSYRLLVSRDPSIDLLLRQIGSEAPDAPWIVVLFGRLDVKDRSRLARQMRAEGRSALLLDETLLLFAGMESEDPLATLFDCAIPFAWVQPYTISAGWIPPEVFFGRESEISRITSRNAEGCLIYGGRQLGKSVLLNHIRGERHRPQRGELALYLDVRSIGGPGVRSDGIWRALAHDLRRLVDFEKIPFEPKDLVAEIETWLQRDPGRRMLTMFDEADNFLRAEHAAGYPNLLPLKSLMERTGRRFKAVFAGLHNVRRMARAPNSPLPHLGDPICIGPMNQSPANRAALRRLAIEPMRAAGLDYSEPGLASDMLARMNYYPSLVQVFGRQIVESYGRRPRAAGTGPRWQLDRETLFEGEAAERVADQIRDRFQLTLNLDVRYDCIARSIALVRLGPVGGDSQVLAQGMTVAEIRRITYWPRALAQPSMTDFEELLEELVDLGILSRFPDNRYGLRNAQVAQMLGGRDALEEALLRLDEREDDPAYDAALFFRSLAPELPAARAPLSDRDLDRLFDVRLAGLRMVRSSPAIAGDGIGARILAAARLWLKDGDHQRASGEDGQLRRALDRIKTTPAVLVVEGGLAPSTAVQLARQPKVAKGEVLVVWCAPQAASISDGMLPFDAGCWSEAMLRHWLADEGLAPALDDAMTRSALVLATGGAPARIEACRHLLSNLAARPMADRASELARWRDETPLPDGALPLTPEDRVCLVALRDLEEFEPSVEDLAEECKEATAERLDWLGALGCLRRGRTPSAAPILTPLGRLVAR